MNHFVRMLALYIMNTYSTGPITVRSKYTLDIENMRSIALYVHVHIHMYYVYIQICIYTVYSKLNGI